MPLVTTLLLRKLTIVLFLSTQKEHRDKVIVSMEKFLATQAKAEKAE